MRYLCLQGIYSLCMFIIEFDKNANSICEHTNLCCKNWFGDLSGFAFFMRLLRQAHFLIKGDYVRNRKKVKRNLFKGYKVIAGERGDKKFYKATRNMRLLEYIAEGEGKYIINGISIPFQKGDMIVMTGAGYPEIKADKIKRVFSNNEVNVNNVVVENPVKESLIDLSNEKLLDLNNILNVLQTQQNVPSNANRAVLFTLRSMA